MHLPHPGLLIVAAVLVWLVLGFDGRLHWDEPHFLYAGAYFPIAQIIAGDFQPSLHPGFTTSRIAHVVLVNGMTGLLGIGGQLVAFVMVLYVALLLVFFGVVYVVLRELTVPATEAAVATVIVMFSPISLYVAWKTLPDVPALMWSSFAVLAAIRLVGDGRAWVWLPIGVLALAMTALTKHVLVWTFVAFAAAAIVADPIGMARARLLGILVALSVGSVVVFAAVLTIVGFDLTDFLAFLAAASRASEPLAARALHIVIALGLLWIVLPIAACHPDRPLTRFFWLWFAIATLPLLVIAPRVEIRYLAPALLPLAGLVFLSLDLLGRRLPVLALRPRSMLAALMILIGAVGLSSRSVQALTAHEIEMTSLHALLGRLDDAFGPGAYAVVTPWEYSTFLYLRLVYPDRPVYDAFDPQRIGHPEWSSAQERFFAGRILRNVDQLHAIDRQLVYVGFPEPMPVANLRRLAGLLPKRIGEPLIRKLDSLSAYKHLSVSWMWDDPDVSLELIDQVGNYHVYQVTLSETAVRDGRS
jgi:hypothetical protein